MPPPRDRMAAMQQQAYLEDDDFHMDMNDEHDPAMQEFFRQIEEMRDTAQQVAKDVEKVKKIQNDILSAPTVDPKMKSELEDTMAGIKKKANTIRTGLKKMEVVVEEEEKANPNNTQMRMKKTQHMAISKTFIEVMTNYNQVQQDFKEQSKENWSTNGTGGFQPDRRSAGRYAGARSGCPTGRPRSHRRRCRSTPANHQRH